MSHVLHMLWNSYACNQHQLCCPRSRSCILAFFVLVSLGYTFCFLTVTLFPFFLFFLTFILMERSVRKNESCGSFVPRNEYESMATKMKMKTKMKKLMPVMILRHGGLCRHGSTRDSVRHLPSIFTLLGRACILLCSFPGNEKDINNVCVQLMLNDFMTCFLLSFCFISGFPLGCFPCTLHVT
jgi:hypothetical protein